MANRSEQSSKSKKPPRRRRGIFEREAMVMTFWYVGLVVVGLLIAIVTPPIVKWRGVHLLPPDARPLAPGNSD
jgi:hypothetical protein